MLCSLIYTVFSVSHSQTQRMPSRKAKERNASTQQSNVFAAPSSPLRQIGSPQSNYLSCFPNANMCYQINKATKDANREIRAARLASVGRKRNETFPSRLCPVFSPLRARHRFVCFLFDFGFESLCKGSGALPAAWEYTMHYSHQVCSMSREVGNRGDIWAKMEGSSLQLIYTLA